MKGYSIEYKLVISIYGIEYKVVTSIILHLEYKWSTMIILQSRHTRGGGINIIYSIASIMVYQSKNSFSEVFVGNKSHSVEKGALRSSAKVVEKFFFGSFCWE